MITDNILQPETKCHNKCNFCINRLGEKLAMAKVRETSQTHKHYSMIANCCDEWPDF